MMMSPDGAPLDFSLESNPFLRQQASEAGGLFGKKIKKIDIVKILSGLSGMGEDDEDDEDDKKTNAPILKLKKASMPKYDPKDLYGGFLSLYGGQKVRGGLLGE
jgi:hypothetical protein